MKTYSAGFVVALAYACTVHIATSATLHVWRESPSPTPPFADWATAAHVIQDAVDVAVDGDTVLVTNGVYATGGRAVYGTMTNRVAVDRAITLLSVNGPGVTVIEGAEDPVCCCGDGAIRCVYLGNDAVLSGFSLRNGHSRVVTPNSLREECGGGVWSEPLGVVTNCVMSGNSVAWCGGGAYGGKLYSCLLTGNMATSGGGAAQAILYNCILTNNWVCSTGGGAAESTLHNCRVTDNHAGHGGGTAWGTLYNCLLTANSAKSGGGAFWGLIYNCTLTGNTAKVDGGGIYRGTLVNCIVYYNSPENFYTSVFLYSCTTPLPIYGRDNTPNEPDFLNPAIYDYRLRSASPCIDAGKDLSLLLTTDIDGNPRPLDGDGDGIAQFDMGAYEYRILTPSEELAALIVQVAQSDLPINRKTPLLASLRAAQASLDRANPRSGVNQLSAFEHQVLAQVARVDADLAAELLEAAERIIELVEE